MNAPTQLANPLFAKPLSVGERIQIYRKRLEWSQEKLAAEVATEIPMSVRKLRRIERGEEDDPGIKTLSVIATKLDVSPETLLLGGIGEHRM